MKLPKFSFRKKSNLDSTSDATGEAIEEKSTGPAISNGKNSGSAKQWLMLHVEKLCLVGAIMLFGFLVYTAIGKLSVNPKQNAGNLSAKAEQMEDLINRSKWDGSANEIPDFAAQVEEASRPIENETYSFKSLVGIESQKLRKRTWPKFLPAEDIWVEGGSGVFWLAGQQQNEKNAEQPDDTLPAGGDNAVNLARVEFEGEIAPEGAMPEIKHWAAITALIPRKKQNLLYVRTYQEAEEYQPLQDVPNYLLARIKRIELTKDNEWGKNLDWTKPDLQWEWAPGLTKKEVAVADTALGKLNPLQYDRWAAGARELVDPRYVHPRLTTPLGPLAYVGWHQWATHPNIPFEKNMLRGDVEKKPQRNLGRGDNRVLNRRSARGAKTTEDGNNRVNRADNFADFFNPPVKKKEQEASNQANLNKENQPDRPETDSIVNENQLLRLFDFDVEPGKTYVYQVQLLLENPNHNKPSRILRDPAHRKSKFVPDQKLPWSKQSDPVYIPPLPEVYAAVVPESTKKEATVILKTPNGADGGLIISQLTLPQGGVIAEGALFGENSFKIDGLSQKLSQVKNPVEAEFLLVDVRSQVSGSQEMRMSDLLFLDANGEFQLRNTASSVDQRETQRFNQISTAFDMGMQKKKKEDKGNRNGEGDKDKQEDKDLLGGKRQGNKKDK